ncbi:MAG: hypothetical protein EP335_01430 [Alphaproteobacteria bacterium]|nr:MAG: hypothetical protein EP335_01430 [Alphaproteobacteria bacterium]
MQAQTGQQALERLQAYMNGPFQGTPGWCGEQVWQTLVPISLLQQSWNLRAPVAEIGPYQGKFFWGLVQLSLAKSGHTVVDIFDSGSGNADLSGVVGNRAAFLEYGKKLGTNATDLHIFEQDSRSLCAADIRSATGCSDGFACFSVDGAHHKDYVEHDLKLAFDLTHPDGVIIVDDYGNPRWHCVQEVVARAYILGDPAFVPVAFSCNKLFLCHRDRLAAYRAALGGFIAEHFPTTRVFETEHFGYLGLTILPPANERFHMDVAAAFSVARYLGDL